MFTKFDKNLANYLVNNKIYIDCYNNNTNNNNVEHNDTIQSNIDNNNTNNKINDNSANCTNETDTELKNLTDEDDSVINSLPDMNEIENYETDNNQRNTCTTTCKNISNIKMNSMIPSSPASSLSSSSSISPSIIDSNGKHTHSSFKDYNSSSNSHDGVMPSTNKKLFNRNIHCVKEKIRRDRIKFSCNELRRLIPNLNGVKTDMASLLETSVLWIQLINSNIPEQLLINVQNKLEGLKILQGNKQYLSTQQQQKNGSSPLIDSSMKNQQKLIRNKNVSETSDLNLKQEIFNPIQPNQHITPMPTISSTMNSSVISQLDTNSPTAMVQNQSILPKLNPLEHHLSNNFMSKPSKWLSITQQKYSDLYTNRAVAAAGGGTFQQQEHQDLASEQRCFINPGQINYNDSDFYNKMTKKSVDFNNNNMYLGQVPFNDQLENYCQNQQAIPIDPSEVAISNSNVYFQSQQQSALANGCLF